MRRVETISYLLNKDPIPNGSCYNWLGVLRSGGKMSLYFDPNRKEEKLDWIEVYDPHNLLGMSTDQEGITFIKIMDIPKYFTRYY